MSHATEHQTEQRELEIKFLVPATSLALLSSWLVSVGTVSKEQRLRTVYFDTVDGRLRKAKAALRIRYVNKKQPIVNFKGPADLTEGLFAREEVETALVENCSLINSFDLAIRNRLNHLIGENELLPVVETRFKRQETIVDIEGTTLAVSLDVGRYKIKEQSFPLRELEIELKDGDLRHAVLLARNLCETFALTLDFVSKAQRCGLIGGLEPRVVEKSAPVALQSRLSLDDAISIILMSGLHHFVSNWDIFRNQSDADAVHQMRVALRRLRAAFKIFDKHLPSCGFSPFGLRAQAIASALGPARDADVFTSNIIGKILKHPLAPTNTSHLARIVEQSHKAAYQEAHLCISSLETYKFVLDLSLFCLERGWLKSASKDDMRQLQQGALAFAIDSLEECDRRVLKRGKRMSSLSTQERHAVRIALKRLRYATEFWYTLFGNRKTTQRFLKELARLQDAFGYLNDVATAHVLLDRYTNGRSKLTEARAFVEGWYAGQGDTNTADILEHWKKFKRKPRFWN